MTLKILYECLTLRLNFGRWATGRIIAINLASEETFWLHSQNWTVNGGRQSVKGSRVGHAQLESFFKCLLNSIIMTESLPLSIYRIHTSSRKETLFNKALPVNLIFVLFARIVFGHIKYFNEFPHRESSSLPRETRLLFDIGISRTEWLWIGDGHQKILILCHDIVIVNTISNPLIRVNIPRKVTFRIWLFFRKPLLKTLTALRRDHTELKSETLNNIGYLTTIW